MSTERSGFWWNGTDLNYQYLSKENRDNLAKLAVDAHDFYTKYVQSNKIDILTNDVAEALETTDDYAQDFAQRTIDYFALTWATTHIKTPEVVPVVKTPPQQHPVKEDPKELPQLPAPISEQATPPPPVEPEKKVVLVPPFVVPNPTPVIVSPPLQIAKEIPPVQPVVTPGTPPPQGPALTFPSLNQLSSPLHLPPPTSDVLPPASEGVVQDDSLKSLLERSLAAQQTRNDQQMGALLAAMQGMMDQLVRQNEKINQLTQSLATIQSDISTSLHLPPPAAPTQPVQVAPREEQSPASTPSNPPEMYGMQPRPQPVRQQPNFNALPSYPRNTITPRFEIHGNHAFRIQSVNTVLCQNITSSKVFLDYLMIENVTLMEWELSGNLQNGNHISLGIASGMDDDQNSQDFGHFCSNGYLQTRRNRTHVNTPGPVTKVFMEVDSPKRTVSFSINDHRTIARIDNIPQLAKAYVAFSTSGQRATIQCFENSMYPTLETTMRQIVVLRM
ncbi:hypothetical protein BLNAU_6721 [Blattamonas nauphoetae]|uniref:Uncharacterized protein n=1 Tax=Blattamonas nauphoetae TaxID=2049346 RepID=A0ABQ9Y3E1_9EUKA|nr:hypothetical protein BLNAU_6721 [Blattamonas nauphoetae]